MKAGPSLIYYWPSVLDPWSVLYRISWNLLLLAVIALAPPLARAGSVLLIYPTLIIFEGNQRSAEISLTNRGDQTGTFEMGWTDMTMDSEGRVVKHQGPAPWSVQSHVRYSPRRVRLEPAESQTIRIALRRGQDIPEGEYYSHFKVLTLQSEDPSVDGVDADEPALEPGVTITARTAVAIPIIWRNSRAKSSASIESVRIDQDANKITVDVRRHGLLSVRGYLHVLGMTPDGTRGFLAEPLPLIIYPSIDTRTAVIELNDGVRAGSLPRDMEVYYSSEPELTDRSIVFASYPIVP